MKKRLVMILLAVMLAFGATGCGTDKGTSGEIEETKEEKDDEEDEEDEEDSEDKEKDAEDEKDVEIDSDDGKDDEVKESIEGMLGTDYDENYDGFEYLHNESLVYEYVEYNENDEREVIDTYEINVFIPNGEYTSVSGDRAYADEMGVDFKVTLNPYLSYDQNEQELEDTMETFIKYQYDPFYCTDFKDLVISDIESDNNSARFTADFCYYDKWSDIYIPIYCTYYLTRLSDDMLVLVETEVVSSDVTEETQDMIEELETFYGFDIEWDEEVAQQKLDNYLANGVSDMVSCSTGYMMFELPKGWDVDYNYGDYSSYAYAPEGDYASAGCVISFTREYMGMESFDASVLLENDDMVKELFTDENGELICDAYEVTAHGKTCLGDAVKISFTASEENIVIESVWYIITDEEGYFYMAEATKLASCETDVFVMIEEILANAIVKED